MMRRLLLIALCALTPSISSHAARADDSLANATPEAVEFAKSLVDSMNLRESLDAWRRMLVSEQSFPSCGEQERDERIARAWEAATAKMTGDLGVVDAVHKRALAAFSIQELRALHEFSQSSLGRRLLAAERQALAFEHSNPGDATGQLAEIAKARKALEADPNRKRALQRISKAQGGEETQIEFLVVIQTALAKGIAAATPSGQPPAPSADDVHEIARITRAMLKPVVAQTLLASYQSMYKSVSTAELHEYSKFLETHLGRKLVAFQLQQTTSVMATAMEAVGSEFSKAMSAIDL